MHRQHGMTVLVVRSSHVGHLYRKCIRSIQFANDFVFVDQMCLPTKDAGAWSECAHDGLHVVGENDTVHVNAQWRRGAFLNAPKVR